MVIGLFFLMLICAIIELVRWEGSVEYHFFVLWLCGESKYNKAIKVMRYTRRFWFEVRCALLVQWGTPYRRRYGTGAPKKAA